MKRILSSLACLSIVVTPVLARERDRDCNGCFKQTLCEINQVVHEINEKQSCTKVITAEDIGTTGYVINEPGNYCLGEDVVFAPENPINFTPITINDTTGTGAQGLAAVSNGILQGIFVVNGGSGYTAPTVSIGGSGSGAAATAQVAAGSIANFTVTAGGSGYQDTVQPAITINSSDVTFSFNGYRLSQAGGALGANIPAYNGTNIPSSQTPFVVGIYIPDVIPNANVNAIGLESIYIEGGNGTIDGFSMWGIYCLGHVADLKISNLTIENCGVLGSYYLRPFSTYVLNGYPLGEYATPGAVPFGLGALNIGESDGYGAGPQFFTQNSGVPQNRCQNIQLNNLTCLDNFGNGMMTANTDNMYITNCHFDNTFGDDPYMNGVVGVSFGFADVDYELPSLQGLYVENSTFNGTSMRGDYTTESFGAGLGVYLARSTDIVFEQCHFDGLNYTFAGNRFHPFIAGFVSSAPIDTTFNACTFNNISALSTVQGFHISGRSSTNTITSSHNTRFINCQASNIQQNGQLQLPVPVVQGGGQAVGFVTFYAKNVLFENCVASDIIVNGPGNLTTSVLGFEIVDGQDVPPAYESDNTVLRGCVAQRVMANQGGHAFGFKLLPELGPQAILRTVEFENCIAEGCMSNVPTMTSLDVVQGVGVGFAHIDIFDTAAGYPYAFNNCKALHNKGVPSIVTDSYYNTLYSAGFLDYSTSAHVPAQRHTYYNCEATDNVYGFVLQNDLLCSVRNCRADVNVASNTGDPAIDGIVGAGFVDLGLSLLSTPTSPAQSFSLFESNRAFANGAGYTHFGANGNYNVIYGTDGDFVPTLTGNLSNRTALGSDFFPQANYIAHNLSITIA